MNTTATQRGGAFECAAVEPRSRAFYGEPGDTRAPRKARAIALAITSGLTVSAGAALLIVIGALTLFRARRLYAGVARLISRAVLWMYGIEIAVHQPAPAGAATLKGRTTYASARTPYVVRGFSLAPAGTFPPTQTVYISNHTSSLDLFILVALGLPRTRFFLSGFLRRIVPLGIISSMMGTFFTVPQTRPAERARIFQRADRILRRTRESVYLSPEGGRITTGRLGAFNKGAFHLATSLKAPIVPLYIDIPREVDPRRGVDARPGTVHVYVLPAIETSDWRIDDVTTNKEQVRGILARFEEELRCA